jgi:dipeptidyl-peptidase-4
MTRRLLMLAVLLLASTAALAQQTRESAEGAPRSLRELTLESIFDPKSKVDFAGAPQSGFVWLDDKSFTWPRTNGHGDVVQQSVFDVETGKERPLFASSRLEAAVRKVSGLSDAAIKKIVSQRSWNFSPDGRSVEISLDDDLYLYRLDSEELTRLTSAPGEEQQPAFSPDGRRIAFVRANNLWVIDLANQRERQLTTDGNENLLNGLFDWVYQEEVFGRGTFRAFWWSPDSARIAFMQLDERPVGKFTVVDHIPTMQTLEETPYPKAGYPNPRVKLFTVRAGGGSPAEVDTEAYGGGDHLIVAVAWKTDGSALTYQVQDREQTWLDLDSWSVADSTPHTILRETTKAWVDNDGDPLWLTDGSFLWLSERSGFKHIYRIGADGKVIRQITDGRWEVRTLHGIDPSEQWIYFSGTERSPIGGDVYRIKLDGTGMTRISEAAGTHVAKFNKSMTQFVDSWSDVQTPAQVTLRRSDGTLVRSVDANAAPALAGYRLSRPEFVQVRTRDGFVMEGMLIKPPNFDPSKKYPVYEHTYSGPHAQQVTNSFAGNGQTYLYHQYLAGRGIIVWICDNRTASGKGAESTWPVYKNFGELELRDLEDGLRWLESQPWVDSSRVLLNGWSYGGFMTSYALTHSTMWSAGISGGTVADWRDYDSIYTERYMLMPQKNPEGYRKSSPRWAAADLHGNLLLLHGAIDDNVHIQNTIQFVWELEKAGKLFQMMIYPKSRHGVTDRLLSSHLHREMVRFIEENLLGTTSSSATPRIEGRQ